MLQSAALEILKYFLLGILQGLTEFLPVSSSGHTTLLAHWWGVDTGGLALTVALHLASTVAVVAVFRADIIRVFRERQWRYLGLVMLCCLVAGAILFPFRHWIEDFAEHPDSRMVGIALVVTGLWQFLADWRLRRDDQTRKAEAIAPDTKTDASQALDRQVSVLDAVLIGVAMACAGLFRGISRSGATIGAGIQLGMSRDAAARFSFLCRVPIILLAAAFEWKHASGQLQGGALPLVPILVGSVAAIASGIGAIYIMLWLLRTARLSWFGAYCVVMGIAAIVIG